MQRHYILTNTATGRRYGRKAFNTRLAALQYLSDRHPHNPYLAPAERDGWAD